MRAFIATLLAASAYASSQTGAYNYNKGGEDWGTIYAEKANNICGLDASKEQSPIDLAGAVESDKIKIAVTGMKANAVKTSAASDLQELNWEHSFGNAAWASDSSLTRTDNAGMAQVFNPKQFHFHTPSEHTVDGKYYEAEMHLVTQATDGTYSVVGLFFDQSAGTDENLFLKSFFDAYASRNAVDASEVDTQKLLTDSLDVKNIWQYMGSFTTPPCTEGVKWNVVQQVQSISTEQLAEFARFTKGTELVTVGGLTTEEANEGVQDNTANANDAAGNNRQIQPLNDRVLYKTMGMWTDSAFAMSASATVIAALSLLAF